jgi:glycosyltransferase involved in cell wall biosynthesis
VSLLTWDEGQEDDVLIDGVRVIKMSAREDGLPVLRFIHPRWTSLVRAMQRADADLYYQNLAESVTGQAAWWCRRHERRFVYSVASDSHCDPKLPFMWKPWERWLYRYGILNADRVIVQTFLQQRMLTSGFGVDSIPLPMPCQGRNGDDYRPPLPPLPGRMRLLWVGRIAPVKRLELFLEVAREMPEVSFDIAGPINPEVLYSKTIIDQAKSVSNVRYLGRIPREQMDSLYENVQALCCTSISEGFPNTFLEAWSHGLPVISTVDPDGMISTHNLGGVAQDRQGLIRELRAIFYDTDIWRERSNRARGHYLEHYTIDAAMARFESVFIELLRERS